MFSSFHLKSFGTLIFCALVFSSRGFSADSKPTRWLKGNLHTHSYWSDGDDYPEMICDWYKTHGYQFLALSDHNIIQTGPRWISVSSKNTGAVALGKYLKRFGTNWVEQRDEKTNILVRLKTLAEFRPLFEVPEKFLLIQSEEITDHYLKAPVHLNATNLRDLIPPRGGNSVLEVMQNNVNAVFEQREKTGQPMIPHLNHPNFGWAVTAEDLMQVKRERFFEVYNGHPTVHNEGDETHASTDRIWDIILTKRLTELHLEPLYGLGTDDSHHYPSIGPGKNNPGKGWVQVRAAKLSAEKIIEAMEAGEFYASNGVRLKEVHREKGNYSIEIEPENGVTYTVQFIGTRKGFDGK
ncbi:MAG: hypothetical protein ACR2H1_14945, partial [Limisphaerales bacterium]